MSTARPSADMMVDAEALEGVIAERRAQLDELNARIARESQEVAALEQLLGAWNWLQSLAEDEEAWRPRSS